MTQAFGQKVNTMNDQPKTDYHDKLLDHALRESLGGESPPDLTERILAAADQPNTLAYDPATIVPSKRRRRAWYAFAAAACLLIAAGVAISPVFHGHSELHSSRNTATTSSSSETRAVVDEASLKKQQDEISELRAAHKEVKSALESMTKDYDTLSETSGGPAAVNGESAMISRKRENNSVVGRLERKRINDIESELLKLQLDNEVHIRNLGTIPKGPTPAERIAWKTKVEALSQELRALKRGQQVDSSDDVNTAESSESKQQAPTQSVSGGQVPKANMGLQGLFNDAYAAAPAERAALAIAPGKERYDDRYQIELGTLPAREKSAFPYISPDVWEDLTARRKKFAGVEGIKETQEKIFELEQQLRARGGIGRNMQAPELVTLQNEITKRKQQLLRLYKNSSPSKSNDRYTRIDENPFIQAQGQDALSTFSIDVDTASYANVRQFLTSGRMPPPDAVRLEELVNYFCYDYSPPTDNTPFAAHVEVAGCPWEPEHRLARIAIKGREVEQAKRPQSNLVFLIDVSGSMNQPNKLPLLVSGMKMLTRQLGENDRVAIVVYASSEGLALPSTRGDEQQTILAALEKLRAGGSTAGGAGIQLAYQIAQDNFIKGGVNRVILATDGDFNVGTTNKADLERLAESKAKETGVFLTVLGFGRGNLNDAMMESISGKGNGNYHYVDNEREARKVLVEEMSDTLVTIAKDVKIQVEFNPAKVAGYRLLGYENRMLEAKDFNDDKKDAGEIGAGHTVTALYEIVPAGVELSSPSVDPLKYQEAKTEQKRQEEKSEVGERTAEQSSEPESDELLTLKLRYKQPDGEKSTKLEFPITDGGGSFSAATDDFKFAAAVASFGMLLRDSEHRGDTSYAAVLEIAEGALGKDKQGYRAEFLELVRRAKDLVGE